MRRLLRRARAGIFLRTTANAGGLLLLLAALGLMAARLLRVEGPVGAAPALLFAAAPLLGAVRALRLRIAPGDLAIHLDRRYGLEGLLLTSLESDASRWQARLGERLRAAHRDLPQPPLRPAFVRLFPPALLLLGLLLIPPPEEVRAREDIVFERALDSLAKEIEIAAAEKRIGDAATEELRQRSEELRKESKARGLAEWADLDALAARLEHEEQAAAEQQRALRGALAAVRDALERRDAGETARELSQLLEAADQAGLLDRLPPDLQQRLARDAAGRVDPQNLPASPEDLLRLAEGLADSIDNPAFLDPSEIGDLQELVEGTPVPGGPAPPEEGGGKGGVERGPGHAPLDFTNQTDGATDAFQAKRLPPGRVPPKEWEVAGVARGEPDANPERPTGAGGEAGSGFGEAAWQRRLAPGHREAVRRFFSGKGKTAGK